MQPDRRLPLVSQEYLHDLEDEFNDPAPVHSFVRDFVAIWDERYSRLEQAVRQQDVEASLDALLSVRIASTMVGATRLARFAFELETDLKRGNLHSVLIALRDLRICGASTIEELTAEYINFNW